MKQILITDMDEQDVPSVALIERISFSTPLSETSFFDEILKSRSIAKVAVWDEKVVGYMCSQCVLDEAHILTLAVHPDFRRTGIATLLVESIIVELKTRACRFLYLEARASNRVAKRLYEAFGFKIIGVRKKYYVSPNEDGIVMMLEI